MAIRVQLHCTFTLNKILGGSEVYIQVYNKMRNLVIALRQVGGFLRFPPPIKLTTMI